MRVCGEQLSAQLDKVQEEKGLLVEELHQSKALLSKAHVDAEQVVCKGGCAGTCVRVWVGA